MMAARRISVLGATGSVGLATLDLIERAEPGRFEVVALSANRNAAGLAKLAIQHRARFVAIGDPAAAGDLRAALSAHPEIEIGIGAEAIVEAASREADWIMAWKRYGRGGRSPSRTRNAWSVPARFSCARPPLAAHAFSRWIPSIMPFSRCSISNGVQQSAPSH